MENETFANDALVNINGEQVPTLELLLMLTLISLLPSLLIMCTSFMRTIIMLSFLRNAMGIQQSPPNMVLVGIALFLTLYIMTPVINEINAGGDWPAGGVDPRPGALKGVYAPQYGGGYLKSLYGYGP